MTPTLEERVTMIFSFDAETDGLYGPVWAIGAVIIRPGGVIETVFSGQLDPTPDVVTDPWVREHIVPVVKLPLYQSRSHLLDAFWAVWTQYREQVIAVADFGTPVEAGLFRACIDLDREARQWQGPYPLHELGTALLLNGVDVDVDRREFAGRGYLVQHDPVDDAKAAGLCWQKLTAGQSAVEVSP
jgi:hypothetical protein